MITNSTAKKSFRFFKSYAGIVNGLSVKDIRNST